MKNIETNCVGDKLSLTWSKPEGDAEEEVAGFYVYRSKEKFEDSGCSECPVRFDKIAEIPYDRLSAMFEKRILYSETLDKGFRYKFRVTAYSIYGDEGAESDIVEIDY